MGATFTSIGLQSTTAYFAQVGDSRAYLIRQGRIQQITRDQSLVGQLVEYGHITEEEAERHTYKNVILQALGASSHINIVVDRLVVQDMDIVALCSDGLSNKVRMEEMRQIIHDAPSLKEACEMLIDLANQRGGEDNITIVIAQFSGGVLSSTTMPLYNSSNSLMVTEPLTTEPLPGEPTIRVDQHDKWGAETIPRDPSLPYEVSRIMLEEEEETLKPTNKLN
jgi:serine/threonine protein phosphatase PrpC